MAKLIVFIAFVLVALAVQSEAYQMTKCQLVRELRKNGFPESLMRDWVCIVEHESTRRTHIIATGSGGWKYYGLFQIGDQFWCSNTSVAGKGCNVRCAHLITDNITQACTCAKKIYAMHQFDKWTTWKNYCKGQKLPDISDC